MEYKQIEFNKITIDHLTCQSCSSKQHSVIGKLTYAYFYIESIPFFPVKKSINIVCDHCDSSFDVDSLSSSAYKILRKKLFKSYALIPMYTGIIMVLLALSYWQYDKYQASFLSKEYIESPKINDFYYIDQTSINDKIIPNKKYVLGKVVSLTPNTVSLVFSRFLFENESSLASDIRGAKVLNDKYFNKKHHVFTREKLINLYQNETVLLVLRPKNSKLFGTIVLTPNLGVNRKVEGYRENKIGLSFMLRADIKVNLEDAERFFLESANKGYVQGQLNLARLYLDSNKINQALEWSKIAALKGYDLAIEFHTKHCSVSEDCDVAAFNAELIEVGF
ncbi:sel1 repeat family protein [Colwellia sp. TT2012]|uniref:sel1 repeat family protein n=1 Tax=Colwellia sp. TT2012 TaxID=1720342 RepID=UPI0007107515|nr:sel1 repeat family protein [Colwellia sp. TT2012]